jgi:acyl-coenzyme A thioesterase PaaI-like protein
MNAPSDFFRRYRELRASGDFREVNGFVPYASVVGFDLEMTPEGPLSILRPRPSNVGNTLLQAVHGGVVGALLEHAAALQVLWECEVAHFPKIINLSVNFLRPCLAGSDTRARGILLKHGRSISNVRVEAWQDDPEKPVAAAYAHFLMG